MKNYLWARVTGPDLVPGNIERRKLNSATQKNKVFENACEEACGEARQKGLKIAEILPTKRQSSKWNNKKGAAWKFGRGKEKI